MTISYYNGLNINCIKVPKFEILKPSILGKLFGKLQPEWWTYLPMDYRGEEDHWYILKNKQIIRVSTNKNLCSFYIFLYSFILFFYIMVIKLHKSERLSKYLTKSRFSFLSNGQSDNETWAIEIGRFVCFPTVSSCFAFDDLTYSGRSLAFL